MGQLLSHPLTEKTIEYNDYKEHIGTNYLSRNGPRFFNCIGSMQGYRLTQEDSHMIINDDETISLQFFNPFESKLEHYLINCFAVFDGHGGNDCSKFLAGNGNGYSAKSGLAKWIKHSFMTHAYGSKENYQVGDKLYGNFKVVRTFQSLEGLIAQVIKDAFIAQDQELFKHFSNTQCGSTAIVAIVINANMLYVANTGDSRCILSSKQNGIKTMSFDHKPQHIGELLRINDNGGTVSLGRVGGVLALSRAFSDFQFKRTVSYNATQHNKLHRIKFSTPPEESQVTVEPDVLMHKIDYRKDEFLVLACDGIWDVYSNKELVKFIKYHLTLGNKLDAIIPKLLDHGISKANSATGVGFDNMTIVVVMLNKNGESLTDWYTKMKIRLEREKGLVR